MSTDDVFQLTVFSSASSQQYMNTMAFRRTITGSIEAADFQDLADELKEIHRLQQNTGLTYTGWKARQVRGVEVDWPAGPKCSPVGGMWFEGTTTAPNTGDLSGELLPQQCAMVTTVRTGTIGRRHRGRWYAPGFGEISNSSGLWDGSHVAAAQAKWNTFFTKWVTNAVANGWEAGVWSYRTASGCQVDPATGKHIRVEDPNPDDAFTKTSQFFTRPRVQTQRRRVIGVGI